MNRIKLWQMDVHLFCQEKIRVGDMCYFSDQVKINIKAFPNCRWLDGKSIWSLNGARLLGLRP